MKDGLGRSALKRIARSCDRRVFLGGACQGACQGGARVVRTNVSLRASQWQLRQEGPKRYELCGSCCEAPAIRVGRITWYLPTLRHLFLWWHSALNRFQLQSTYDAERTFVFSCDHYDASARRCDSYETRPGLCRDYPHSLLDQATPVLFANCGYKAIAVNRRELVQILENQDLGSEQLEKLKEGLYLDGE